MFFVLSKVLWFVLTPSNALIGLGMVGVILLGSRLRRLGRLFVFTSLLGLFVCGLTPLPNVLMVVLEERFPAPDLTAIGSVDGIIVLGGATSNTVATARSTLALNEAAERIVMVPDLARQFTDASVVLTGGVSAFVGASDPKADLMMAALVSIGVEPGRIVRESKSRNTAENASETFALLQPTSDQRFLLVTSAFHMPRAVGAFREAGWRELVPFPVDYRTRGASDGLKPFAEASDGLRRFDTAIREIIGLIAYRLTGRTDALFPAP